MRRAVNGLTAIIRGSFKLDPFSEALFVFCNKKRDRIRALTWDQDGFWLFQKRLEKGHFKWPTAGKEATMELADKELEHLLGNTKLTQKLLRQEVNERLIM